MYERPLEDWEYPDEDQDEDEGVAETSPCPHCGADIYEDAQRCAVCGDYVALSTAPTARRPWWFVALGLAGIAAVIIVLALAGFGS